MDTGLPIERMLETVGRCFLAVLRASFHLSVPKYMGCRRQNYKDLKEDKRARLHSMNPVQGTGSRARPGIAFNRHFEVDGTIVSEQACALGCEGMVSKRFGAPYRPGRTTVGSRSRTQRRRR